MDEIDRYTDCLLNGRPYFGSYMNALSGNPRRHIYMQELVKEVCAANGYREIKILEIGSWAGGSAISWAEAIRKYNNSNGTVVCVDPWVPYFDPSTIGIANNTVYEEMYRHAKSGDIYKLFIHNISVSGYSNLICPFRGNSDRLLPLFNKGSFDIVFIDGDHRYGPTIRDLLNTVGLVKNGGCLCGDDLELQIHQIDIINALKFSNKDFIVDPWTQAGFHPGVTLAVGKLIGPVSVYEGFWVVKKELDCWNHVILSANGNQIPHHFQFGQGD